jgi:manganese efflux pump family protein
MEWAALIAWILTAGGGFLMLAIWFSRGGMRQQEAGRIRPPLILGHFALAATGLVLWIIYVLAGGDALAWIAFILLLVVAALGFTMFTIWYRQREAQATVVQAATAASGPPRPAEQHFPVVVVGLHGIGAVTTLVLVLLAALDVGTS